MKFFKALPPFSAVRITANTCSIETDRDYLKLSTNTESLPAIRTDDGHIWSVRQTQQSDGTYLLYACKKTTPTDLPALDHMPVGIVTRRKLPSAIAAAQAAFAEIYQANEDLGK